MWSCKEFKIQKEAIQELREANERNSDIAQRLRTLENDIKTSLRTDTDSNNDRLVFLRTDYDALLTKYSDLRDDLKTLTSNQETLTNKENDDYKDLLKKYNNLIILHNNLKGRHDALTIKESDNNKELLEKHNHLSVQHSDLIREYLVTVEKLKRAVDDITQTKTNLEQQGIIVQRVSVGNSVIKNDLNGVIDDLDKNSRHLNALEFTLVDINSKTDTLETDFDNHIKYAERLKNNIDNIQRRIENYPFPSEKYKILLCDYRYKNKTLNISYKQDLFHHGIGFNVRHRGEDYDPYNRVVKTFNFSVADTNEYFDNFSFNISNFKYRNTITPVYDIDLYIDLTVYKLEINSNHPDYIGGFIFNTTKLIITEISLDGDIVKYKTIEENRLIADADISHIGHLHLKANKQYKFSFF